MVKRNPQNKQEMVIDFRHGDCVSGNLREFLLWCLEGEK